VTVRLNTKVKPADLAGFDAVIPCLGSVPLVPPIPGIENARPATEVFGAENSLGDRIVVIGGGQVGCEAAIHLVRLGKTVTLIEMRDALAPDASPTSRDELLVEVAKEKNLTVLLGAACTNVERGSVTYRKEDGSRATVTADAVVLAAGMKARQNEADALIGVADYYAQAGDCVRPRTVEWAVKEGFYAAMRL
jgi:pyruvate/2-oxoglutarate dehydrogenase complex dihydrolipoamide dehydrogenase (E3) component